MKLTAKIVALYLRYHKSSGRLVWVRVTSNRVKVGQEAGTFSHGYRVVALFGHIYRVHHIAWLLVTGNWPKNEIDHKNTKRADNRWQNLREATRTQNNGNTPRPRHNTSGFKGVSWHAARRKWAAYINIAGKTNYLGLHITPELAHAAYMRAARKQFGNFARAS